MAIDNYDVDYSSAKTITSDVCNSIRYRLRISTCGQFVVGLDVNNTYTAVWILVSLSKFCDNQADSNCGLRCRQFTNENVLIDSISWDAVKATIEEAVPVYFTYPVIARTPSFSVHLLRDNDDDTQIAMGTIPIASTEIKQWINTEPRLQWLIDCIGIVE